MFKENIIKLTYCTIIKMPASRVDKFSAGWTNCRLTIRNSARLFHIVLLNMGYMHLVLPALNLYTLNAGILIMMHQVRLMMFSLNMVDYSMSFLLLSS